MHPDIFKVVLATPAFTAEVVEFNTLSVVLPPVVSAETVIALVPDICKLLIVTNLPAAGVTVIVPCKIYFEKLISETNEPEVIACWDKDLLQIVSLNKNNNCF
jgi:hypothetical protein